MDDEPITVENCVTVQIAHFHERQALASVRDQAIARIVVIDARMDECRRMIRTSLQKVQR